MPIHITEINVYPIKSTRRVSLDRAAVERRGLRGDRRWMIVDEDGVFLTQRDHPKLALIGTVVQDDGLSIQAPAMETLRMAEPDRAATAVRVWRDTVPARDAGDKAADWFTRFLGRRCRVAFMHDESIREIDRDYAVRDDDHVSFADGYPILLASTASLAALNERAPVPVPMTRFRPNLVVSGADPFEEDEWREIEIGGARFDVVKGCTRCVVTTIDQDTAVQGKEPLRTLDAFRKRDGKVWFGQNLIPAGPCVVQLRDEVVVKDLR